MEEKAEAASQRMMLDEDAELRKAIQEQERAKLQEQHEKSKAKALEEERKKLKEQAEKEKEELMKKIGQKKIILNRRRNMSLNWSFYKLKR